MSIDGTWKVEMKTPMGAQAATAVFTTSGSLLTGTVSSAMGSAEITDGRVEGDKAWWILNLTSPMPLTLKHEATFSGDTVSGEADSGLFGKFPFQGARA